MSYHHHHHPCEQMGKWLKGPRISAFLLHLGDLLCLSFPNSSTWPQPPTFLPETNELPRSSKEVLLGLSAMRNPGRKLKAIHSESPSRACTQRILAMLLGPKNTCSPCTFGRTGKQILALESVPESSGKCRLLIGAAQVKLGSLSGSLPGTCWVQATQRPTQLPMAPR